MRKRYYLSFDMDDPRHREAERLFTQQASRQRTEFVVSSILALEQNVQLEQVVRQAVREELNQLRVTVPSSTNVPEPSVYLEELPDSLIHALEEL
ncbi:hypothetical protein [Lacrimispora indolis]|uniref:hypothetical protein n=1 Tax=Lacrimispora indolis TaxID=69825 RepID=UPI000421FFA3|nr:hypothetical protein [[Clostridium] methoxybenzovorans]